MAGDTVGGTGGRRGRVKKEVGCKGRDATTGKGPVADADMTADRTSKSKSTFFRSLWPKGRPSLKCHVTHTHTHTHTHTLSTHTHTHTTQHNTTTHTHKTTTTTTTTKSVDVLKPTGDLLER